MAEMDIPEEVRPYLADELYRLASVVQERREESDEQADYRWFRDMLTDRADELRQERSEVGFAVQLICCERDEGTAHFATWQEADDFRNSYTSGPGVNDSPMSHQRVAIVRPAQTVELRQEGSL